MEIFKQMNNILADINAVSKSRLADMGNAGKYNFRGIDDMYNELHSSFAKYKVFLIPKVLEVTQEVQEKKKVWNGQETVTLQYNTTVKMSVTFYAEDGSFVEAIGVGHALDTSDKGTNKAQSSALKYILMQTFLIPTIDDKDVENNNNQVEKEKSVDNNNQVKKIVNITSENEKIDWLTNEQYQQAKEFDIDQIQELLTRQTSLAGNKFKMKKEFRESLTKILEEKKSKTAEDYEAELTEFDFE